MEFKKALEILNVMDYEARIVEATREDPSNLDEYIALATMFEKSEYRQHFREFFEIAIDRYKDTKKPQKIYENVPRLFLEFRINR